MRTALATLVVCTALTACDTAGPINTEGGQPDPDAIGKADGSDAVEIVETDEPLLSTTFKRMLCQEITPVYGWDTAQQRDAFSEGCTDHDFTVTQMVRSTLYTHADDADAVTLEMKVRVDFEDLSFQTTLYREYADYQFSWAARVDDAPDGQGRDEIIEDIASDMGEYFWPDENPETFRAIRFDELPEHVAATARELEQRLDQEISDGRPGDGAGIFGEHTFEIHHDGEVIGYAVSIAYFIDDPLFDGGGTTLYLNTLGDVVEDVEWWG